MFPSCYTQTDCVSETTPGGRQQYCSGWVSAEWDTNQTGMVLFFFHHTEIFLVLLFFFFFFSFFGVVWRPSLLRSAVSKRLQKLIFFVVFLSFFGPVHEFKKRKMLLCRWCHVLNTLGRNQRLTRR